MSDSPPTDAAAELPSSAQDRKSRWKLLAFVVLAVAIAALWYVYRDQLRFSAILSYKQSVVEYSAQHPVLVYGLAFLIYVTVTGLSLPGAAAMSLLYAAVFGFWRTVPLVSFAATTAATLAFLMSRYLLRDFVQSRFSRYLEPMNRALEREGAFYLFTLRLIPYVPFFILNLVMGLTPIPLRTYWWVSQLGMLPGTCVFVYAGTQLDPEKLAQGDLGSFGHLLLGFGLLGAFPLVAKFIINRWRGHKLDTKELERVDD